MTQCVASRNSRDKVARKILFYVVANIGLLFRDLWELQERGNVQSPSKPFAKLRRPQRKKNTSFAVGFGWASNEYFIRRHLKKMSRLNWIQKGGKSTSGNVLRKPGSK